MRKYEAHQEGGLLPPNLWPWLLLPRSSATSTSLVMFFLRTLTVASSLWQWANSQVGPTGSPLPRPGLGTARRTRLKASKGR